MARRQVVEVQCSRCDRTELRDVSPAAVAEESALIVQFGKMSIIFEDLCEPCMGAVRGHLEAVAKKITGLSPARKKGEIDVFVDGSEPVAKKKSQTP